MIIIITVIIMIIIKVIKQNVLLKYIVIITLMTLPLTMTLLRSDNFNKRHHGITPAGTCAVNVIDTILWLLLIIDVCAISNRLQAFNYKLQK